MTEIVPQDKLPFLKRRQQAKARKSGRLEIDSNGRRAKLYRADGSGFVTIERDGNTLQWATSEWVPNDLLDKLAAQRNMENRAPLGDSHGAWQKCAEIPLTILLQKIPFDAWGDERAMAKVLNDPDLRAFRCDGNHRRF